MTRSNYFPPIYSSGQYHCPHCGVYAKQFWNHIQSQHIWGGDPVTNENTRFSDSLPVEWHISKCGHCQKYMIWLEGVIIYPEKTSVEAPNADLNEDIKEDYLEASRILNKSPRGAAALLRLGLQKLLKQLGEKGENLNDDIKNLVKKGLNPTIQKGLDFVRVTGNNAVHPGQIDLKDNNEIAEKLFQVINFIAEKMITEQKEVESLFEGLPEDEKEKISKRDRV